EMPHAWQNNFRSFTQTHSVTQQRVTRADLIQRVLDRTQIARAVIEDGDHSSPFVDGSWPRRRLSVEHAYFMARAKHLKMASILWWLERPYNTFACRLVTA